MNINNSNFNRIVYFVGARVAPSLLSSLPFILLFFFLNTKIRLVEVNNIFHFIFSSDNMKYFIIVFVIFLMPWTIFVRHFSKITEYFMFHRRKGFPTTYLMLFSNPKYSDHFKKLYRNMVKNFFNIELYTKTKEVNDLNGAIKLLNEASRLVKAKVNDGNLVFTHNAYYGFVRNLVGGSIIAFIVTLVILLVDHHFFIACKIALLIIYFSISAIGLFYIKINAEHYA